jgi:hypothetical protein
MKRLAGLIMLANVLGLVPTGAAQSGFELASLQSPAAAASLLTTRNEARTLVKEDECDTPETIALIESNREDIERTVVMDR